MGMTQVIVPVYPGPDLGLRRADRRAEGQPGLEQALPLRRDRRGDGRAAFRRDDRRRARPSCGARDSKASRRSSARSACATGARTTSRTCRCRAGAVTPELLERTLEAFHRVHEQFYGYSITGEVIELIRFNVDRRPGTPARSASPRWPRTATVRAATGSRPARSISRSTGWSRRPIYRRDDLPAGFAASGPLIVEEVSLDDACPPWPAD